MASRQALSIPQIVLAPDGAETSSPAVERIDAKTKMLKAMRPLPTQHYWNMYFDRPSTRDQRKGPSGNYGATLEQIGQQIESVQDFWRYNNNMPVDLIKMRESLYLFKQGFQPIWEDRRNANGGSWTFRISKAQGPDFWTRVQLMAIGEKLQSCLNAGDQLCGVGFSVRFNAHLITVWHRDSSKQDSIDAMLRTVLEELPDELRPRPDKYYYKKHSEHAGFKPSASISTADEAGK